MQIAPETRWCALQLSLRVSLHWRHFSRVSSNFDMVVEGIVGITEDCKEQHSRRCMWLHPRDFAIWSSDPARRRDLIYARGCTYTVIPRKKS